MRQQISYKLWVVAGIGLASLVGAAFAATPTSASQQGQAATRTTLPLRHAVAALNPTKGNTVHGLVKFDQVEGGVRIVADVDGLTPGKHGFHIHEFGDCSALDGASAGGHYNPFKKKHAGPDNAERHVGDLGNIVADQNGHGHYERVDQIIELNGEYSIVGRSVIVHANADDFTSQPAGNAGARVSCGVIVER